MGMKERQGGEPTLSREVIFEGRVFRVEKHQIQQDTGRKSERELVFHRGGVTVLAMDAQGEVYLVRQYRKAAEAFLWELPAGKLEAGEEADAAIRRELEEETGLRADQWQKLGEIYPTPGYCTEKIHLYLARDLHQGEAHPDPGEDLEITRIPLTKLVDLVLRNEIQDAKTAIATLMVQQYLLQEGGAR